MRCPSLVRRSAGLVLVCLLACSGALAQDAESSKEKHDGKLRKSLSRLLGRLDLSDAKRQAVKSVLESHQTAVSSLFTRELEARQALREATERRDTDEQAMRDALDTLAEVEVDFALERASVASELLPLLDDDQRVKLIRFVTSLEREVVALEREWALPARKGANAANVSDEERAAIKEVIDASRSAAGSAASSLTTARTAVVVVTLQPNPDRALVRTAAESAAAADRKLARVKAGVWSSLMDVLVEKQRGKFKSYAETLDEQVLRRHEAACLFFLELL